MADLVWGWVAEELQALDEAGERRLADLMVLLPDLALEDHHAQVDALMPEALALARAAKRPWVEVYLRHWHLQSRVLVRAEAEPALADAVALVDFAHEEATRRCPQAICALQDLTVCYGLIDGPGYAEERIAVANEILPTLEPERGCFSCLSMELAGAMADQGRPGEALAWLDRQVLRALGAGRETTTAHVRARRADLLIEAGRHAEALAEAELGIAAPDRHGGERRKFEVLRARALVGLGRAAEIGERLPTDAEVLASPGYGVYFAEALEGLAAAGQVANDVALGQRLRALARAYEARGSRWNGVRLAVLEARLALGRGALGMTRRALAAGRAHAAQLRDPARGEALLAPLEAALAAAEATRARTPIPTRSAEEDAEQALDRFERGPLEARRRGPEVGPWSALLETLGYPEEADAELERALATDPPEQLTFALLGHRRRTARTPAPLEQLIAGVLARTDAPELRATAAFLRGLRAAGDDDLAHAERCFDEVLEAEPDSALSTRFHRARVRARRGDHAAALLDLDHLAALTAAEPGRAHPETAWRRLTAATVVGDWVKVRSIAADLGMTLTPGDGPIEERWGIIRIESYDDAEVELHHAERLGPAHARIVEVSGVGARQRYRDVVAFFPSALEAHGAPSAEGEPPLLTFAEEVVLSSGGFRAVAFDGAHPGEDRMRGLEAALAALGGTLQIWSAPELLLEREDGSEVRRCLGVIAVPKDTDDAAVDACLAAATEGAETPALRRPPTAPPSE